MGEFSGSDKTVIIVHPLDPVGKKVGGIGTFIKNFIKYAPEEFLIEFVGVTCDPQIRVGEWQDLDFGGRRIRFFPVLYVEDENVRPKIPLSLRFTVALASRKSKISLDGKVLDFHRIETSMPFGGRGIPRVLFVHGHMKDIYNPHSEVRWAKFPPLYFQLEKRLIKRFDRVYVVREDGAEFYKQKYPALKERFQFLPTWVDDELFFPCDPKEKESVKAKLAQRFDFSPEESLVVFVGRLEGQKDPLLLVEVFKRLAASREKVRLLIVGTGSLEEKMRERLEAYGVQDRVTFVGVLLQPELAELLRVCDVFLLTSAFEGMPMSVLEALACGLPVVSTDVGEVKRVVKDGVSGVVCSSRDPEELCNALERVLDSEEIERESCVAAVKPYTARSVLRPVYELHRQLFSKNS